MLRLLRRTFRKLRRAYGRRFGPYHLRKKLQRSPIRIVIGAGAKHEPGWIATNQEVLDLLKPGDWERFFQPDSIDAILAEHVWEHLSPDQARTAAGMCFRYLKPGGYLRLAVPDGFHPDPVYQGWVKVGGAGEGLPDNDHKVLYTYQSFADLFRKAGFTVELWEYFDEKGRFQDREWDVGKGKIWRTKRFDKRNRNGKLVYTSILMDAVKPVNAPR
jgi:predicted SAM-dependent methyltransferase